MNGIGTNGWGYGPRTTPPRTASEFSHRLRYVSDLRTFLAMVVAVFDDIGIMMLLPRKHPLLIKSEKKAQLHPNPSRVD